MVKVIGITGMPASGKTTVTKSLKKKGIGLIHLGDFILHYLKENKIKRTQETSNMASLYFWEQYKDIPIAEWAYDKISKKEHQIYLIDGIRTLEEVNFFKKKFKKNFELIAVLASPKIRKKRENKRRRFHELDFKARDKEELTIGVGDVIAYSDYYIDGNKTKKEVKIQANKILRKLTGKKNL